MNENKPVSNKLNVIFSLASIALLISLVALFHQDHNRTWKKYQREFQQIEKEKTKEKLYESIEIVESSDDYKNLIKKRDAAKLKLETIEDSLSALYADLDQKETDLLLVTQKYQFKKAQYDSDRYLYEAAVAHHSKEVDRLRTNLVALKASVDSLRLGQEEAKSETAIVQSQINDLLNNSKTVERELRRLTLDRDIFERKLSKIDEGRMGFAGRIANFVRNQPMVDMLNPSLKVDQTVIKDISDDVHFMQVPKVDRCMTCHKGILNPDFQNASQPFTAHPDLDLFLASNSPHPAEEFGCTSCHNGRGRGTSFTSSAHTPSSSQQAKEWKEKYNWEEMHHWETPMFPKPYTEAGCLKCHQDRPSIQGAEKLNLGLNIIEKAGCYNCHMIEKYKGWPPSGPSLEKLASKTSKDWSYRWIQDPKSFRHGTWMPSFFHQSNTNDPESIKRTDQEIHAIVHYLFEKSELYETQQLPMAGDIAQGEKLFTTLGCLSCHQMDDVPNDDSVTRADLRNQHGPNLTGLGSKTSKEWIYNWIKDPSQYHETSRMPNFRLSDEEAAHITAYLHANQKEAFSKNAVPPVNVTAVTTITEGFLKKTMTTKAAKEKAAAMTLDEKLLFTGEKLIRHYGCFSCHNIAGFLNENPIGTELSEEGSKPVNKFDFGNIHDIPHTREAWLTAKLKDPRLYDQDKVKEHFEKLKMPNFNLTDEEVEAVVTALLGLVKEKPAASKLPPQTPKKSILKRGSRTRSPPQLPSLPHH